MSSAKCRESRYSTLDTRHSLALVRVVIRRATFATDGQRFFFTIGTRASNVWEMTLERR